MPDGVRGLVEIAMYGFMVLGVFPIYLTLGAIAMLFSNEPALPKSEVVVEFATEIIPSFAATFGVAAIIAVLLYK